MVNITNPGIAIDPKAELEGRWMSTPWDGVKFKIAGSQTPQYYASLRKNLKRRNSATLNELSSEEQDEVLCETLAEVCWLDWEGLKSDNGETVPYSTETAVEILKSRAYVQIREFVSFKASLLSSFYVENVEEITKN